MVYEKHFSYIDLFFVGLVLYDFAGPHEECSNLQQVNYNILLKIASEMISEEKASCGFIYLS